MTTTASQIAAVLCHERPGLTPGRIHRLLYLAQGHHLAWHNKPLFGDAVVMWDTGVIVPAVRGTELDGEPGLRGLPNGILNTVAYVCSRYGKLHLHDLDLITKYSAPALAAGTGRAAGVSVTIGHDAMAAYFRTVDVDPDRPIVDARIVAGHVADDAGSGEDLGGPDDLGKLREWVDSLQPQLQETPVRSA